MELDFGEIILEEELDFGELELDVIQDNPPLIDLIIEPSNEQQVFNHEGEYGYDKVTVGAIKLQDKEVQPTNEEQFVIADEEYNGLKQVKVNAVTGDSLEITPSIEEQEFSGVYSSVKVSGDADLLPENIKKDVSIFGVNGNAVFTDFEINDCRYLFAYNSRNDIIKDVLPLCKNITDTSYMFSNSSGLTELNLSSLDTSEVTDMRYMFNGNGNLTELNLSNFNTDKVTNMSCIFYSCGGLTKLDLSNFNTSKVTNMYQMFYRCQNLVELDLSSFDTNKVTNMGQMFYMCSNLTKLDLRNFTFDKVTNYSNTFSSVPVDCLIIVKGDTEKEWILARRSDFTNVKTVAEYEGN